MTDKKLIFLIFLTFCMLTLNAQTFFSKQKIIYISNAYDASSIYVTDIDNDGDLDVLSASADDNKIVWYENTNGSGIYSFPKVIADSAAFGEKFIIASDIDGDNDPDVLSAIYNEDKIVWYNNSDGHGVFESKRIISNFAKGVVSLYVEDLDNDDDLDVISASYSDDMIAWYENTDGQGSFDTIHILAESISKPSFVYSADLDGDGDADVLSTSFANDKITWYENTDGLGTFGTPREITSTADGVKSVYVTDLDSDGDNDIISASYLDNTVAWYENTDGGGLFSKQHTISNSVAGALSVHSADLDGDGDKDVISASSSNDKIIWYENIDGYGMFGQPQIVNKSAIHAESVILADLNGDDHPDILYAARDFEIGWHKNLLPLKILSGPTDIFVTCMDHNINLSVKTGMDSIQYQWQVFSDSGYTDLSDDDIFSNVHSDSLFINMVTLEMSGNRYRCIVFNYNDTLISDDAFVILKDTVNPEIVSTHPDRIINVGPGDNLQARLPDYTNEVFSEDNCDDNLKISQLPAPKTWISGKTNKVVLFASDQSANSAKVEFNVEVSDSTSHVIPIIDTIPPEVIHNPGDQTLDVNNDCQALLPNYAQNLVVTDNYSWPSELIITQVPEAYTTVSDTLKKIILTVTDQAGNHSIVTLNIEFVDTEKPTISCGKDQTLNIENGQSVYKVSGPEFDPLFLDDNCEIASIFNNVNHLSTLDGSEIPTVNQTIIWTIIDEAGNIDQCSFDVIINNTNRMGTLQHNGISVYPNPTGGEIFVESKEMNIRKVIISDLTGKTLLVRKNISTIETFNLSNFCSGIYQISILTESKVFKTKIVFYQNPVP